MGYSRFKPSAKTVIAVTCLIALFAFGQVAALGARANGPGLDDSTLYDAVLPDQQAAVLDETAGELSSYHIVAEVSPNDPKLIEGNVEIRFVNTTGTEQESVYLRLYANDPIYEPFGVDLDRVAVSGAQATHKLSVDDTVVEVLLPEPLAERDAVDLSVEFSTQVPPAGQGYGMFGASGEGDTLSLAHWYPILAGYGPDGVWNLDPPSTIGDPIFSGTALYEVEFTAGDDFHVVTTGRETDSQSVGEGRTVHRFVTGPARDFMMVIDNSFDVVEMDVDGTTVRSWFDPADRDAGERVLTYSAQALRLFNDLIGQYPYDELDVVEVPVGGGAAGVEFPQLVLIATSLYDRADTPGDPTFLENVVAHEIVHQWWYGLVGNDQYYDAFIDEGLTNYLSTAIYFETFYSPDVGAQQVDFYLTVPYLSVLFDQGDEIVDQPTDNFSPSDYGVIIYGKAALGFGAIREALGDDAFIAALQDYYLDMRFKIATPDDLLAAFERASGEDLGELWHHWFEAAEGEQDFDEDDLVASAAAPAA